MNQVWEYEAIDGKHRGIFMAYYDRGGTDVSYKFQRLDKDGMPIVYSNGGYCADVISGRRLKSAKRIGAVPLGEPFEG